MRNRYEGLVIGGGVMGRCALYHLQRMGLKRVALVEQFEDGHNRGSSHSFSRVTRSAYADAGFVRLMDVAHGEEWPRLERDSGEQLIHPNDGCFFGASRSGFESYVEAIKGSEVDCEILDMEEGRRRFPMFRFGDAGVVLHDHTAGVVAAERTMRALRRIVEGKEADWLNGLRVTGLEPTAGGIRVTGRRAGERVELKSERVVITAGPWARMLVPELRGRVETALQTVGYFELEGRPEDFGIGSWPVWAKLAMRDGRKFYGLPSFGRPGIKIARHVVSGTDDDPDEALEELDDGKITELREFLEEEFTVPVSRFLGGEHCFYTNTHNEDYVVDQHPEMKGVVVGAGFTGHGFKLAPVVGRALAELVMEGKTGMPAFERMRERFKIA